MFDFILGLIDRVPFLHKHRNETLVFIAISLALSILAYPVYFAYRYEERLAEYFFNSLDDSVTIYYSKKELEVISSTLLEYLDNSKSRKVNFQKIVSKNSITILEVKKPLENPLPLGFQTIYLPTKGFRDIFNSLRKNECYTYEITSEDTYLNSMLKHSYSKYVINCPSSQDWYVSAYFEEAPELKEFEERQLKELVRELEKVLVP